MRVSPVPFLFLVASLPPVVLGDQIYITRGHAREPDGQQARKLKDLVRTRGRPWWGGPLVRVWGMRLLVSWLCGSINARARSMHFVNGTRRPVTHILQVENTRSGPARGPRSPTCDVLYEKKKNQGGSSIYFTVHILRLQRWYGEDLWATGNSLRLSTFYVLFSRATYGPAPGKWGDLSRQALYSENRKKKLCFIIGQLLFALTIDFLYSTLSRWKVLPII